MLNLRVPENEPHLEQVRGYIENDPEPGYLHASEEARQAFMDMKYGVRIHWGLYTLRHLRRESWPFLKMSPKERQEYQRLYQKFNPTDFNADGWMEFFQRAGLKCFAITTKHHEGFSLFDTKTRVKNRVDWTAQGGPDIEDCDLAYSVMDTPFKRDIIQELCDAAHRFGIMIDFYFSHPDWYDADFRPYCFHPLQTRSVNLTPDEYGTPGYHRSLNASPTWMMPDRTPEETARMVDRHRQQLTELLTSYGKIDMLCLDMWLGKDAWPELRQTIKLLRQLQPDVMLRCRGIGNYGDYYTPEGFVPGDKANTDMPWMVIYPLGRSFSYEPVGSFHKGPGWIIKNLISSVAKGGNFMVGIGPDEGGKFHPRAVKDLETVGEWLKVYGEAIYATRAYDPWHEGNQTFFTRSKDQKKIYALCLKWPGRTLKLKSIPPKEGMQVHLLGMDEALSWRVDGEGVVVDIPTSVRRTNKFASAFRFAYPD